MPEARGRAPAAKWCGRSRELNGSFINKKKSPVYKMRQRITGFATDLVKNMILNGV